MRRFVFLILVYLLTGVQGTQVWADFSASYDSSLGTLPSAQGWTPEATANSAFSVSNGLLNINAGDIAYYDLGPNSYDHTLLYTEIRSTLTVSTQSSLGIDFIYYDSARVGGFIITSTSWNVVGNNGYIAESGLIQNPTALHTFDYLSYASSNTFTFSVDGTIVASGTLPTDSVDTRSNVYFGQGSTGSGTLVGEIASVYYSNSDSPPVATPEPSSFILCYLGTAILVPNRGFRAKGRSLKA